MEVASLWSVIAVTLISLVDAAVGQGAIAETGSSYGTEFWIPFPEVYNVTSAFQYRVYITNPNPSEIEVTVTEVKNAFTTNRTLKIPTRGSQLVVYDPNFMMKGEVSWSSYARVTGSVRFGVHVMGSEKMDAFTALPVASWGIRYVAVTYGGASDGPCQVVLVANADTQVTVKLPGLNQNTAALTDFSAQGSPSVTSLTLTPGDVYQLQRFYDITGAVIESTAPIGVLTGSASTIVGQGELPGALMEFLPPSQTMGSSYVVFLSPTTSAGGGDLVRVVALTNVTNVYISSDYQSIQLQASQYITRVFRKPLILVESDLPVLVVTFTQSSDLTQDVRYPTMSFIPPTEFYIRSDTIVVPEVTGLTDVHQFVVIVASVDFMQQSGLAVTSSLAGTNMAVSVIRPGYGGGYVKVEDDQVNGSMMVFSCLVSKEVTCQTPVTFSQSDINPSCSVTENSPGDNVDNDCDGQIDEDACDESNYKSFTDCGVIVSGHPDIWGKLFTLQVPDHCPSSPGSDNILLYVTAQSNMAVSVTLQTPLDLAKVSIVLSLSVSDRFKLANLTGENIKSNGSRVIADQVLQVTSSGEISVVLTQVCPVAGAVSMMTTRLLPHDVLGREYFAATVCVTDVCQIQVAAPHKGVTSVRIRLRLQNNSTVPPFTFNSQEYQDGDVIVVNLTQYQSLQLQSLQRDLTGTHILATKPVTVLSGGRRTTFLKGQAYNGFVEQLPPVRSWGRSFIVQQSPATKALLKCNGPCMDSMKVVASTGDTVVSFYGALNTTITLVTAGDFLQFALVSDYYAVKATKPIQILQITQEAFNTGLSASIVSPVDQYMRSDRVVIPSVTGGVTYLMIDSGETGPSPNVLKINNVSDTMTTSASQNASFYTQTNANTVTFAEISSAQSNGFVFGGHVCLSNKAWTGLFQLAHEMTEINPVCLVTTVIRGDNIDNDCDGQVDEEPCDPMDDARDVDNDGMMNEDCVSLPVSTVISSSIEPKPSSLTIIDQVTETAPSSCTETQLVTPVLVSSEVSEAITTSTSIDVPAQASIPDSSLSSIPSGTLAGETLSSFSMTKSSHVVSVQPTSSSLSASSTTFTTTASSSLPLAASMSTSWLLPTASEAPVSTTAFTASQSASHKPLSSTVTAPPMSIRTNGIACGCHCPSNAFTAVLDASQVSWLTSSIQKELYLNKDEVSANKRRYVSIVDLRPSAQTFGYLGLVLIVATLTGMCALDAKRLFSDFIDLIGRCRGTQ